MKKFIIISVALILEACCDENHKRECTNDQLQELEAEKSPVLISTTDGVKLYRIWTTEPEARSHWTYFTTPCGDTSATINFMNGKISQDMAISTNGSGCK